MNRYRRKVDSNHRTIENCFRSLGVSVAHVSSDTTAGFPDLVCGYLGRTRLVEVKPDTQLAKHQPSAAQQKWAQSWKGGSVALVRNVEQVAELVACWRVEYDAEFRAAKAYASIAAATP